MAERRKGKFAAGTVQLAALGLALVGLAALGGAVNTTLDAVNHFAPLWTAAALVTAVAGLALGGRARTRSLALSAAALTAGAIVMAPELLTVLRTRPAPAVPGDEVIKVVQFNAWGGRGHDPVQAADWIAAQNADFVLVQESDDLTPTLTRRLMASYPHRTSCARGSRCPVMILSRREPVSSEGYFRAPSPLPITRARYAGQKGPVELLAVHMAWPLPARMQAYHRQGLLDTVKGLDRDNLVIAGDFNSTPWSYSLRGLDRRLGMARRTRALPSWPAGKFSKNLPAAPLPLFPIDQLYAGKHWRTVSVERGPAVGSDHYPLVTVLAR